MLSCSNSDRKPWSFLISLSASYLFCTGVRDHLGRIACLIVSICTADIQYHDLGVILSDGYFNPIPTSCPLHPCQCLNINSNSHIQSTVVSSHSPNITLFIHSFICPMETNRAAKISQHYGWWTLSLKKKAGVVSGHGLTIHSDAQLSAE